MRRAITVTIFIIAIVIVYTTFGPTGRALGQFANDAFRSMLADGSKPLRAALVPLVGIDAIALVLVFVLSLLTGVIAPSGLPQVFFALYVPMSLAVMQARFFELTGDASGLTESFGAWNFVASFALAVVLAQVGVNIARGRHEGGPAPE